MENAYRPKPIVMAKVRAPRIQALERPRLAALLGRAWGVPLTLLVAPSGSGKTTALCHFCDDAIRNGRPVAWCQVEETDADEGALLRHLDAAFALSRGAGPTGWSTIEDAAATIESSSVTEQALVIDDLHLLEGSTAEKALERLTSYLPSSVHLIVAGRRPPSFNLPRLRLQGQLNEIGPDDLRFRSWEINDLFRQHFAEPLPQEELSELLRRTDGWAAGLQMFRLATTGKSASQRHEVLTNLSGRLIEVREYLDRNLLEGLDDELRQFLVRSSALGRVTASWCDELLDDCQSDRLLYEVERRYGFLAPDRNSATLRYSEVLQDRLHGLLVQELGERGARDFHRRAAHVLEAGQAWPEALRAYCAAEDWDGAERLLNLAGERIFDCRFGMERLPPALPGWPAWSMLAKARREVAAGYWAGAVESYRRAEGHFGHLPSAEACRRERRTLERWLGPSDPHQADPHQADPDPGDWIDALRHAFGSAGSAGSEPHCAVPPADPTDLLTAGLSAVLRGCLAVGTDWLDSAAASRQASPVISGYAGLVSNLVRLLLGEGDRQQAIQAAEAIERAAPSWLSGLVVALASANAGRRAANCRPPVSRPRSAGIRGSPPASP